MALFLDASHLLTLAYPRDPLKPAAKALRTAVEVGRPIHTHALVVAETVATVGSRCGGKVAQAVYEAMVDDMFLHFPDPRGFDEAMITVRQYDGTLRVSDAYALLVMRRENIKTLVSLDGGFDGKGVGRLGASKSTSRGEGRRRPPAQRQSRFQARHSRARPGSHSFKPYPEKRRKVGKRCWGGQDPKEEGKERGGG